MSEKKWRTGPAKRLYRTAIKRGEYPLLVKAMKEDGLHAEITEGGIVWSHGSYSIIKSVVAKVWGLSEHQFRKFETHILEKNPWGAHYDWDDYFNGR